jgi:hypothetical protein
MSADSAGIIRGMEGVGRKRFSLKVKSSISVYDFAASAKISKKREREKKKIKEVERLSERNSQTTMLVVFSDNS